MRWIAKGLIAVAQAALLAAPLSAQQQGSYCGSPPPKGFSVAPAFNGDQMSYSVITTPNGRALLAEGGIGSQEGARLAQQLQSAGAIDEVLLSSPGGDLLQGMEMGRVLRKSGLLVRVPADHACISACTIAFLGGVLRTVDPTSYYGVHMFSIFFDERNAQGYMSELLAAGAAGKKDGVSPAAVYQTVLMNLERSTAVAAGQLARYLVEMSASLEFLSGMFGQKQLGVCFVTPAGRTRYNITNSQ